MHASRPVVRVLLVLVGASALLWVSATSALVRADGSRLPEAWTVVLGGVSLLVLALARNRRWRRPLAFLALAVVGQSAALGLIDAPSWSVFQHYRGWRELLTSARGLLLIAPVGQTAVIGAWLASNRDRLRGFLADRLSPARTTVLLGILLLASGYPSWDLQAYLGELVLALWIVVANAGNLVVFAASIPSDALAGLPAWIRATVRGEGDTRDGHPALRAVPWLLAVWVVVASGSIAVLVFDRVPHVPDAVSYLFQARYFSEGLLYLPAPPMPEAFEFEKLYTDGLKWWGYGFPGWPAVLALGVLAGVPWAVNPVLGGVTILLAHRLVRMHYGDGSAAVTAGLLALSPWLLFMSASHLAHPLSAVLGLVALIAVSHAVRTEERRPGIALVAGVFLGALLLTRPLEAILVGGGIGLWLLTSLGLRAWRPLLAIGVGGGAVGALIFPYNRALTGSPLRTPHEVWASERWYPGADRLGFGGDVGNLGWTHLDPLPGHGLPDVLINFHQNVFLVNFELFGWIFGSLLFVLLFLLWRRWVPPDRLFIAVAGVVCVGHAVYWFGGGPDIGARYWYQTLVPLALLTVRGIQETARRLRISSGGSGRESRGARPRLGAFVATAVAVGALTVVPWRALGKYHDYRGMNDHVERLVEDRGITDALVIVRETSEFDYPRAFILNPPTLASDGNIYARELESRAREVLERHFPDREIWTIEGSPDPSVPYRVVSSPFLRPGKQ